MEDRYEFGTVLGSDCIQAEVFSEMTGLVQSAVDGYNVLLMTFGAIGSGKTHTMLGGQSSQSRGVAARVADELFMIQDRDHWRQSLHVEVQAVRVTGPRTMVDLFATTTGRLGPRVRLVPKEWDKKRGVGAASVLSYTVAIEGAATRRASERAGMRSMLEDVFRRPAGEGEEGHVLVFVHLTRTNKATAQMTRSRIVLADLAGLGRNAREEINGAYYSLETLFQALTRKQRGKVARDHVLTQAVQDCMGGSSKTVLLVELSPSQADLEDSLMTLRLSAGHSW